MQDRYKKTIRQVQDHLLNELIPFWLTHGTDAEYGGYLTYFDSKGRPTGETDKTLVCQTRMLYTSSASHRANLGVGKFLDIARQGFEFLVRHFWDEENTGWFWVCAQDGTPINRSKLTYGQSFAIYGLSEYAMASGDSRALDMAQETHRSLTALAADNEHGGFLEFLEEDWKPKRPGVYGGDRKSFDVHMHLMEAFTNLYEATGEARYKEDACYVIGLIFDKIIDPRYGTGLAQFALDWTPLRAIIFKDVWGSDRDVDEDEGRPLDNTSFGHNVEFAWLLKHSIDILGLDVEEYAPKMRKLYDHCCDYGIDWERGGVYCEGPGAGPARERNKEFWQQAETMVGMLDAHLLLGDERYFDAYENVHNFVMDHVINHKVGEWYPLFDENNHRLWDYLGHAWKINYHTVRGMIQSERRLSQLIAKGEQA
jgi:mannobiose 2-epimerase